MQVYKLVAIYHWSSTALPRQPLESRCEMPAGVWSLLWPGFRDMWPRHSRVTRDSARHYTRPPSPHTLATRTVHHREDAFDITQLAAYVYAKMPWCLGVFIKRLIWSHSLPQIRLRPHAPRTSPHRGAGLVYLRAVAAASAVNTSSIFCFCGSSPLRSITSVAMAGWCPAAGAVAQSDQIRWVEIIIGWNIARAPLVRNYLHLRGARWWWNCAELEGLGLNLTAEAVLSCGQ